MQQRYVLDYICKKSFQEARLEALPDLINLQKKEIFETYREAETKLINNVFFAWKREQNITVEKLKNGEWIEIGFWRFNNLKKRSWITQNEEDSRA